MSLKSFGKPIEVNPGLSRIKGRRQDEVPKRRRQTKTGCFVSKMEEFCKRTDLHGYKYIVMRDLTFVERCCWAVAVLVSALAAVYFVLSAYRWYARNPIVTVIESTHGAIWDAPFPAVTICNVNTISRRAAFNFSQSMILKDDTMAERYNKFYLIKSPRHWTTAFYMKMMRRLPINVTADEVFEALRLAPLLHSTFLVPEEHRWRLQALQTVLDLNDISTQMLFRKLSPVSTCKDLVQRCMWKNTIYRCELLFHSMLTQFSVCCTFNYYALQVEDHSNVSELVRPPTPRRVASCGYQTGLTVLLYNNPADYYSAPVASYGSMVIIDNAYNIPDIDSPKRLLNPSAEMFIALNPERTYATSGIKAFARDQRQCLFKDEVNLGVFSQYTYHNCMLYRRVEIIERHCGCVPFFFPTKGSSRNCNFTDLDCLETVRQTLDSYLSNASVEVQCLPDCEHFDYPMEVALGQLAEQAPLDGLSFFKDMDLANRSLLNVFFNDLVSTRYRRDVYLNWQNLLASFGGLLSLMLGFTLISAIDLVIFFTFHLSYGVIDSMQHPEPLTARHSPHRWTNNAIYVTDIHKKDNWF